MRAWVCEQLIGRGGLQLREDWPEPVAAPGQVIIDVRAAALNYPDLLMLEGKYQHRAEPPYVPGLEAAGVVRAVGEGADPALVGQAVIAGARGALAERIAVAASDVFAKPAAWTFAEAAAFRVVAVTAYHALVHRAALRAGEVLLVNGASGGTGHMAVKVGRALGARVIATTSDAGKVERLRALGADAVVLTRGADFVEELKTAAGRTGVNVVFDPVGGPALEAALKACGWGGRIAIIGFTGGGPNQLASNYLLIKGLSVLGVRAGEAARHDPRISEDYRRALMELALTHDLRPHVDAMVPFADAQVAFDRLAARQVFGKIVVGLRV
jgi:NADPH2:quinone reductase